MVYEENGVKYRIEKSKDDRRYCKMRDGVKILYVPSNQYDQYMKRVSEKIKEGELSEVPEVEKNRLFDEKYDQVFEEENNKTLNKERKEKLDAEINQLLRVVNQNSRARTSSLNSKSVQSERKKQDRKEIKSNPTTCQKKYKGIKAKRIKALIGAIIVAGTVGLGAYGINSYRQENKEIDAVVDGLNDKEIKNEIYEVLKKEVSKATGVNPENIDISRQYDIENWLTETIVNVEENEYKSVIDLIGVEMENSTLKGKGISRIVTETNNAENTRELIKVYRKARKFSEKKDMKLVQDEDENTKILKEVREEDEER